MACLSPRLRTLVRLLGGGWGTSGGFLLGLAAVAAEGPRGGKLTQLVADHIFRHEHLHVLLAVVDHERQPDKLRHNGAGAGPRRDRLLGAGLQAGLHLLEDFEVYEWTFFC